MNTRIVIQKHCEVLGVDSDPKENDTYNVRVLLTKETEELAPEIPLKLKGSSQEIVKILFFLGEAFNQDPWLGNQLDDLSIAPITFELKEKKIIATDVHGKELINATAPEILTPTGKVKEFSEKFFKVY